MKRKMVMLAIIFSILLVIPATSYKADMVDNSYIKGESNEIETAIINDGNTLYVGGSGPNNYTKIQDAINNASDGDTVFVFSGTYYENVVVNKIVNLIGEDKNNTIIEGSGSGDVVYVSADDMILNRFTIRNGGDNGIELYDVQNCFIENNIISNNNDGIHLYSSSICAIIDNTVSKNRYDGIYLDNSSHCQITGNTMIDDGIFIDGYLFEYCYTHTIDTSNTVNGKPVYYWSDVYDGGTVPAGAGQIILANCGGVTVENQDLSNGTVGIELISSARCTITGNTISNNNRAGIYLWFFPRCTITGNTICNNNGYGIYLNLISRCTITGNTICNNRYGIGLTSSNDNNIHYNNIYGNTDYGVYNYNSNSEYADNATHNWWGSSDGPGGVGPGSGDAVSNNVIFGSWLTNQSITSHFSNEKSKGTPGFEMVALIVALGAVLWVRKKKK